MAQAMISGMNSPEEAKQLAEKIRAGALPFSMKTTNYNTISPTLGNQALQSMAAAAAFLPASDLPVYDDILQAAGNC